MNPAEGGEGACNCYISLSVLHIRNYYNNTDLDQAYNVRCGSASQMQLNAASLKLSGPPGAI